MTTVRVVFALQSLRAARAPDGSDVLDWRLHQRLVVLADTVPAKDGGHRAVPLWLRVFGHKELLGRVAQLSRPGRAAADAEAASGLLETAVRLLRAPPSSSRPSTPRTTAAARSPSAGSCAPPASPARPGCTWP